ncbi:sensor histidine kinase [Methylobacterium iners]|uniref:histidine kinase n=1 Tax=Methylobacterium iners TaxID=418707 RepID=A0ABQ4RXT1_9HYPH|nr:HWE histidine kinase domain-containing protein [Methylobacterium iners]GJD94514.1 hypothetical protein OCOJLMKI_1716 [Methylobacterium iners]
MSLTKRISGLIALALVPALAIQGYNEYALRSARGEAVRNEAMRAARGIASDLGQFNRGSRQVLSILAGVPEIRNKDPEACTAYLKSLLGQVPGAFFFGVTDADGGIVCNTLGSAPGAYSLADREYFRDAMRTNAFATGPYVSGRITKRPTMQFAYPIAGEAGRPTGVVIASIDLDWLAGHLANAGLPANATLTVADRFGTILIHLPDHAEWVGKPLPPAFWKTVSENRGNVVEMLGLRGNLRITGIAAASSDDPDSFTVAVRLSRSAAYADIDAATWRGIVLILTGALLAFAAALLSGRVFIRRPVRRLLNAVTAWRSGDLTARSGVSGKGEFGQLGEAFDTMANALQRHESDLRQEIARSHLLQEQQTMMLHELNHRVRNTLATVQSLTRQSRKGDDNNARLEGRIISLSKTHDLLSRDDWTGASLMAVLENELIPFRDDADRFGLAGPDVELSPRYVLALGMTLHELTTNAAKYGALSNEEGRVDIAWDIVAGETGIRRLKLEWRESGGPIVEEPRKHGFGTRLITGGISRELGGTVKLEFASSGLRCVIDVPLDEPDRFTSFRQPAAAAKRLDA